MLCPSCKKVRNIDVEMVVKYDKIICEKCKTSFTDPDANPLGRYFEEWKNNGEKMYPLVRPPLQMDFLANVRLYYIYEDCYHCILTGRYNASIVLLGVLLEALMKERIYLKSGMDFQKPYGAALKEIKNEGWMRYEDIAFLEWFKNEIRNPYQHSDEKKIMKGKYVAVWPINIGKDFTLEKLADFRSEINSKKIPPQFVPVSDVPAVRSVVKKEYDEKNSVKLFNQVYDFLLNCQIIYFNKSEYDEFHRKFHNILAGLDHYDL
jgi:hypothetical protein